VTSNCSASVSRGTKHIGVSSSRPRSAATSARATRRSVAPIRPIGLTELQINLGDGCVFGLVPLGSGRTYGFAYVAHPHFHDPVEGRLARLRQRFSGFGPRVAAYLAALERDDEVICSAMEWMELGKIRAGRVVLVGDAAHASSPMMGQGGCMAMEDACVLAEELRAAATVEAALENYVRRRKPRVEWVQRQSMGLADLLTASSAQRNTTLRQKGHSADARSLRSAGGVSLSFSMQVGSPLAATNLIRTGRRQ
jgi:2-polyprenyl-6-methoxyphenol hydroxylase-like FAD-dependent oxidoreductase